MNDLRLGKQKFVKNSLDNKIIKYNLMQCAFFGKLGKKGIVKVTLQTAGLRLLLTVSYRKNWGRIMC